MDLLIRVDCMTSKTLKLTYLLIREVVKMQKNLRFQYSQCQFSTILWKLCISVEVRKWRGSDDIANELSIRV